MSTPIWQPGTLYLPGDLVQPIVVAAPVTSALANPDFEAGSTGWTLGTGCSIATDGAHAYQGTGYAAGTSAGRAEMFNNTVANVVPGQSITVSAYCDSHDGSSCRCGPFIEWQDAGGTRISLSEGDSAYGGDGTDYFKLCNATGSAPAGAAKARLGIYMQAGTAYADNATWNYATPPSTYGLIYKAVQTGAGTSAATEPTWPTTLGVQVIDNTVTWEAVNTNRVIWQASPILLGGATEPAWPTRPGGFVSDGTISWECVSRRVEDKKCPNTKVVAIMASKVFAVDKDIVRFCATANPLDWTTESDAGYLPTGLQQANANDMAVLAPYRSNLAAFNASCFQNWQVDPDPTAMAALDQMEGIGSTWPKAAQAVGNELFFLSQLGVRTVGISIATDNLSAGDVGMPIDPLIQAELAVAGTKPLATYYPGAGQYWLAFSR